MEAVVVVVAGQDLGVKYKHHKVDYNLHKWGCYKHYKHWRTFEDGHSHYRDSWDCPTDPWEGPPEWERPNTDRTSQAEVVSVVEAVVHGIDVARVGFGVHGLDIWSFRRVQSGSSSVTIT